MRKKTAVVRKDLKARLRELYLPPADDFVLIDVPDMRYMMIDGEGRLEGKPYPLAVKWLFTVAHPLKQIARKRMGKDFVEAPLEALWWAEDIEDFMCGNKDRLNWRLMIVAPDWLDDTIFGRAVAEAQERLGEVPRTLRLEEYREGKSAQIMHIGPPQQMAATVVRLHEEFLPAHGLVPNGYHHEIYLNDPNRVAPEKLRTVIRQPVRSSA